MIGMVLGSVGIPFSPWQAAQICTFVAMSSAAYVGMAVTAKPAAALNIAANKPFRMAAFLHPRDCARFREVSKQSAPGATRPRPIHDGFELNRRRRRVFTSPRLRGEV